MSGIIGSKLNIRGSGLVAKLGTDGQHLLSSGAGKSASYETLATTDVSGLKQDIATLALHSAVADNKAAYNLANSFIDQFESDAGLATQTNVDRVTSDEYVASVYSGDQALVARTTGTAIGDFTDGGGLAAAFDDVTNSTAGTATANESTNDANNTTNYALGKDWGSGNTKYITGFKWWSSNNDGVHTSGTQTSGCSFVLIGHTANDWTAGTTLGTLGSLNFRTNNTEHSKLDIAQGTGYRYHWVKAVPGTSTGGGLFCAELRFYETPLTANATGTLINAANTVASAKTAVSGVALYKDAAGTATIGTDLKVYFACDGGAGSPDWTETSYTAVTPVFSTGIKMLKLGEVTGLTSGTDIRYKVEWANQSAAKQTQLHGIALSY